MYRFLPSVCRGSVTPPASKSHLQRLLFAAALAPGESLLHGVSFCQDTEAAVDAVRALGARVVIDGDTLRVVGADPRARAEAVTVPCRESGAVLRFSAPLCLLSEQTATLTGAPSLLRRPLDHLTQLCRQQGLTCRTDDQSVTLTGPLSGGAITLSGGVGSQLVSGLFFALPLCRGESVLTLLPPVVSRPYLAMTARVLAGFGVRIEPISEHTYHIPGEQRYAPTVATAERDWSSAAPFFALDLSGGSVRVEGLDPASDQADAVAPALFERITRGETMIDLADCPDLGPLCFVLASLCEGGVFLGTDRQRNKESDRLEATKAALEACGGRIEIARDAVRVHAARLHPPAAPLDGADDHRVVMALSVLLAHVGGDLDDRGAVAKSYPDFFSHLRLTGVDCTDLSKGNPNA